LNPPYENTDGALAAAAVIPEYALEAVVLAIVARTFVFWVHPLTTPVASLHSAIISSPGRGGNLLRVSMDSIGALVL
jgi:hypothetical protein